MLTMDDLIDAEYRFPTFHALDYANGYLDGKSNYTPAGRSRADVILRSRFPSASTAYRAGYARASLDLEAHS